MLLEYKNSKISYTTAGEGSAIVLLHGFLETLEMWDELTTELSETHQIIAIDLLGHGKTDSIGYIHTMEAMADAVLFVLKYLNIKKAKFIGHSMGGYVALALADSQPELFEGLCLMNSTFEADSEERKSLRKRAIIMAQNQYDNLVRMSFANLFAPRSKKRFPIKYNKALEIARKTPVQGYIAAQEGMMKRDNRLEIFNNISGKKLMILGKKDTLIDIKKTTSQILNTSIVIETLSEGHMSHVENYNELSYILLRFSEK
ncbi:MAG: alpha/beta hydrolase [Winogradskyella sp.]|uniref:alpha/beta fold hydrolase n=1 Tax=Winogradskyella sp. TaxID=1883156 RepID=UPI0025E1B111|nr:alpha/beta hydrolase [Winogradskyella sp.]NRB59724.1 alpha/beta hydrolase [Winogradskyella sp.]